MSEAKQFIAEVTITKTFRITIGGDAGTIRLEGESDEDAAEMVVNDWAHLSAAMLPPYIKLEDEEMTVEEIREVVNA